MNDERQTASSREPQFRRGLLRRISVVVVFYLVSVAVLYCHIVVWPIRFKEGDIAGYSVLAPIDFSYVDEPRLRELTGTARTAGQVQIIDRQMGEQAQLRLSAFQDDLAALQQRIAAQELTAAQTSTRIEEISNRYQLEPSVVEELLRMAPDELMRLLAETQKALASQMEGGVTRSLIGTLKEGGTPALLEDPSLLYAYFLLPNLRDAPPPGQQLRQLAQMDVSKGSAIVTAGTVVSRSQADRLSHIEPQLQHQRIMRLGGLALLQIGAILIWLQFLRRFANRMLLRIGAVIQFSVLYLAFLIVGLLIGRLSGSAYEYAVAFAVASLSSVVVMVYDAAFAVYFGLSLGVVLAFALNMSPEMMAYTLGSSLLPAVVLAPGCRKIVQLLFAILMGLFNALLALSVGLLAVQEYSGIALLTAFIAGASAAIVALGLVPVVEAVSSQLTPGKLLELANPENEVLRRLKRDAPGTYAHCHGVADLAEEGAKAVGANWQQARVGALYHDIGKLKRPAFFAENIHDLSHNPHQGLPPESSVRILRDHVSDGMALAREIRLPAELQRYIAEHHGTYLIKYFYYEAVRLHTLDPQTHAEPQKEDFCYTGPIPSSRETAIVMLADICEAVFRSRRDLEADAIEELLDEIFAEKIEERQLVDSRLTIGDLANIKESFLKFLVALRHQRPAYPVQLPAAIQFHYLRPGQNLAGHTAYHD